MLFGPRLSSIFKSRWIALFWAAGIIWAAVDFVGVSHAGRDGGNDASAQPVTPQDAAALKHFVDGP